MFLRNETFFRYLIFLVLINQQALPHFSRIPGLVLPGSTFSECLMVLQFLRSFGKVLRLDMNPNTLHLSDLQEGLLNTGDSMGKVQDLLVNMLSAVVCDPGIPAGHKVRVLRFLCCILHLQNLCIQEKRTHLLFSQKMDWFRPNYVQVCLFPDTLMIAVAKYTLFI